MKLKNKRYFLILFLVVTNGVLFSQQYPQFTQYTYNMNVVNPAYAGSRESLSVNMLGKTQWVGVEGAPKTGTFSIHSPIGENVGLGFSAIYDEIGPLKDTYLFGDFSYTLRVSDQAQLALGLKAGVSLQTINPALFRFNNSQSFNTDFNNKVSPNFGVGAYYFEEKFYAGISIPNILETDFFQRNSGSASAPTKSAALFLTSGYVFDLNREIKLKPATMIRYQNGFPISVDISATAFFQDTFELGVSYRYNQSINFLAAINVNDNFRFGYAYDYSIGDLSTFNNGSHEVLLLFDLPVGERIKRRLRCF
jgi:type IX secretion system PorP/SprF family membrane protein